MLCPEEGRELVDGCLLIVPIIGVLRLLPVPVLLIFFLSAIAIAVFLSIVLRQIPLLTVVAAACSLAVAGQLLLAEVQITLGQISNMRGVRCVLLPARCIGS